MEPSFVQDGSVPPLRLRAEDPSDLEMISACLQDAITRPCDMTYRSPERRFALVFNRFRWEREASGSGSAGKADATVRARHQRIRTGVHFDGCLAVKSRGLDGVADDQALSLLAIECEPLDDGAAKIVLRFAGDAAIQMYLECIDCRLRDMTEPWEARARPDHLLDEPAGDT